MYPFVRMAKEFWVHRNAPALPILGAHVTYHRCWPQDIDAFMEMNNGRILTILDLGRTILAQRVGLLRAWRKTGWSLTMAGSSVRYRKRIRPFVRFKSVSRCVGWDDRFLYLEHTLWIGADCAVQALYRSAVTDKNGIVAPRRMLDQMNHADDRPVLPEWVQAWIDADGHRPWPPENPLT